MDGEAGRKDISFHEGAIDRSIDQCSGVSSGSPSFSQCFSDTCQGDERARRTMPIYRQVATFETVYGYPPSPSTAKSFHWCIKVRAKLLCQVLLYCWYCSVAHLWGKASEQTKHLLCKKYSAQMLCKTWIFEFLPNSWTLTKKSANLNKYTVRSSKSTDC